jgi:predicted TIM-barrel fold metal-dependent hydrolase
VRALCLLVVLLAGCPKREAKPAESARSLGVVDTHLHVAPTEIARLHEIMDEQGIAWGLNLSGMWPGGPLEEQLAAAEKSGRLVVACNLPWFASKRLANFPEIGVEILKQSKELGARALKVEKALGLAARKPDGSLLAVDDPWLDPIWRTAGELSLPVVIHTGDPKAFWLPIDEKNERYEELKVHPRWSNFGDPEVPSFEKLLEQLMNVVTRHPKTTFVAVHFGNNAEDPAWVGSMLEKHANLHVDLAARLPEIGRHDPKVIHELFTKYADRILFGTDMGLSPREFIMLGSIGEEPNKRSEVKPFFDKHWRWLETWDKEIPSPTPIQGRWNIHGIGLSDEVLRKIYRENATRLFGGPKVSRGGASTSTSR